MEQVWCPQQNQPRKLKSKNTPLIILSVASEDRTVTGESQGVEGQNYRSDVVITVATLLGNE